MLKHNVRKVKHRIVSLSKPYIRPIIREKERKRIEVGAKVHTVQIDGLNVIEHLRFEAFHEGNRMWKSIHKYQEHFEPCTHYGADNTYATNRNRKICTAWGIQTCFKPKGRRAKDEHQ